MWAVRKNLDLTQNLRKEKSIMKSLSSRIEIIVGHPIWSYLEKVCQKAIGLKENTIT